MESPIMREVYCKKFKSLSENNDITRNLPYAI